MNRRSQTELFASRMIEALRKSKTPISTDRLATIAGCSKKQAYLVINWARRRLEKLERNTIHSTPGVGYRICGLGTDDDGSSSPATLPANKQHDLVDEQVKTAGRIVAHAKRHYQIGELVDPSRITDLAYMEALGLNKALGGFVKGFIAFDDQIKSVLRPAARKLVAAGQVKTRAPFSRFGLDQSMAFNRIPDDEDELS